MTVRRFAAGVLVAGLLAGLVTVMSASPAAAHTDDAYSHGTDAVADNTDWMGDLPDSRRLSELSVPGTHDSGACCVGGDITVTNRMNVANQLKSGIRMFDVRLGNNLFCGGDDPGNPFYVFHGSQCQNNKATDYFFRPMADFLRAHPTEAILMRIQEDEGNNSEFASDLLQNMTSGGGLSSLLYRGGSTNPTLGELRGKALVFDDFPGNLAGVTTIEWATSSDCNYTNADGSIDWQDCFSQPDNWHLADKWYAIRDQLTDAQNGPNDRLYINFTSAASGGFPYFFASGKSSPGTNDPRLLTGWTRGVIHTCSSTWRCIAEYDSINCFLGTCSVAFKGANIMTKQRINAYRYTRVGLVLSDFPGRGLIDAIIAVNDRSAPPFGALDEAIATDDGALVRGWAIDDNVRSPVRIHIYVDGVGAGTTLTGRSRPDVDAAFPGRGGNHGYVRTVDAAAGQTVCTYAIDDSSPTRNRLLGCRVVANALPFGAFDELTPVPGGAQVRGWAIDASTTAPIGIHVYVDGVGAGITATGLPRPDVNAVFDRPGDHGYIRTVPAAPGQEVCVYAIDAPTAAANPLLGCKTLPG